MQIDANQQAYSERVNGYVEDHASANDGYDLSPATAIVDFVTDLRHLAAKDGIDFEDVIRLSAIHYNAEVG